MHSLSHIWVGVCAAAELTGYFWKIIFLTSVRYDIKSLERNQSSLYLQNIAVVLEINTEYQK